jgi:hypothetical protein
MKPKTPWYEPLRRQVPLVHRRALEEALARHEQLLQTLADGVRQPHEAEARWLKEPGRSLNAVVCLVSARAQGRRLPSAVNWLLQQHVGLGHRVVLVLGLRDPHNALPDLPAALVQRLSGVLLRRELGGDLGAWSHAHHLLRDRLDPRRLALINDRWIGPLDEDDFDTLWRRVEASTADAIGYTELPDSTGVARYLRADALVFGREAWLGGHASRLLDDVLAFDDPQWQHEIYEQRWTRRLKLAGLRCEALFSSLEGASEAAPSVALAGADAGAPPEAEWSHLLAQGFPFVHRQALRQASEQLRLHPMLKSAPMELRGALRAALGPARTPAAPSEVTTIPSPGSDRS